MPLIDLDASKLIRDLREERGLSPEALADEIAKMVKAKGSAWTRGAVDAYTIRRIEGKPDIGKPGFVPTIRVQFVLATYFELPHTSIWKPGVKMTVPAPVRVAA